MFIDAKRAWPQRHQKQSCHYGLQFVKGPVSSRQTATANIVHSFTQKRIFSLSVFHTMLYGISCVCARAAHIDLVLVPCIGTSIDLEFSFRRCLQFENCSLEPNADSRQASEVFTKNSKKGLSCVIRSPRRLRAHYGLVETPKLSVPAIATLFMTHQKAIKISKSFGSGTNDTVLLVFFVVGAGVCAKWVLRGRFHALSSAGKMEDWTGLYISLSRRIFYHFTIYGFAFRGQTSFDVLPWVASRRG